MFEGWNSSHCCCHFPDSRECFRSRYAVSPDNHFDPEHDGECECACHGEYEEYWLDREDAELVGR